MLRERSQLSGSTLQPLASTVYHDLRRFTMTHHPPLLARSVTELGLEGTNIGYNNFYYNNFTHLHIALNQMIISFSLVKLSLIK